MNLRRKGWGGNVLNRQEETARENTGRRKKRGRVGRGIEKRERRSRELDLRRGGGNTPYRENPKPWEKFLWREKIIFAREEGKKKSDFIKVIGERRG